ncbi:hypothetical protein [Paracoccus pacificus]|uniref:Uncharacterized protein n=1 Tax=Paracoccus pacificus TaxID=1463598 RepID=A0ABW4R6Q2_9RHOB
MRILVTLMLMAAFVTMTVSATRADISMKSCTSQLRAQEVCYAAAVLVVSKDGPKKGGACCELVLTRDSALNPPQAQIHRFAGDLAPRPGLVVAVPRPPPRG